MCLFFENMQVFHKMTTWRMKKLLTKEFNYYKEIHISYLEFHTSVRKHLPGNEVDGLHRQYITTQTRATKNIMHFSTASQIVGSRSADQKKN